MLMTPEQRVLRSRIGFYAAAAKHGRHKMTEAARAANPSSDDYWLAQVDPELDDAERRQRAADMKRAHFARLAYKSAQARKNVS